MKDSQFPIEQIRAVIREELEGLLVQLKENFNTEKIAVQFPTQKVNGLPSDTPEPMPQEEAISAKLSLLISDYSQEKIRSGIWSLRTQDDNTYIGELMIKILGDVGGGEYWF